jgi:hypothetical protein
MDGEVRWRIQPLDLFGREGDVGRGHVLLEVRGPRRPGDGEQHGGVLEEPGEGQLGRGGAVLGGDSVQRPAEYV